MALSIRKSNLNNLISALKTKRTIGTISQERSEIREALLILKINETIEIDLPKEQSKTYEKNGKKSTTHPLLDKIKLEAKEFNSHNRDTKGLYVVAHKESDIAYVTKHNYNDIKDSIVFTSNKKERVSRTLYYNIINKNKNNT
jgi:hypothetical protein